jgi:hypothetical protein
VIGAALGGAITGAEGIRAIRPGGEALATGGGRVVVGAGETVAGRGAGMTAAGGAAFRLRVRALPVEGAAWVWAIRRAARTRIFDMTATIASQPMNGKLLSA